METTTETIMGSDFLPTLESLLNSDDDSVLTGLGILIFLSVVFIIAAFICSIVVYRRFARNKNAQPYDQPWSWKGFFSFEKLTLTGLLKYFYILYALEVLAIGVMSIIWSAAVTVLATPESTFLEILVAVIVRIIIIALAELIGRMIFELLMLLPQIAENTSVIKKASIRNDGTSAESRRYVSPNNVNSYVVAPEAERRVATPASAYGTYPQNAKTVSSSVSTHDQSATTIMKPVPAGGSANTAQAQNPSVQPNMTEPNDFEDGHEMDGFEVSVFGMGDLSDNGNEEYGLNAENGANGMSGDAAENGASGVPGDAAENGTDGMPGDKPNSVPESTLESTTGNGSESVSDNVSESISGNDAGNEADSIADVEAGGIVHDAELDSETGDEAGNNAANESGATGTEENSDDAADSSGSWICLKCGTTNEYGNFCGACGSPRNS